MNKKSTVILLKILYVILVISFIAFIFSNSLESREVSSSKSTGIVEKINEVLEQIHPQLSIKEVFVRKSAHFIEYFILGSLVFGFMIMNRFSKFKYFIYPCFFCCLIAMTDETIQYFSQRGSMLIDVWLDLTSSVFALLMLYLIHKGYVKIKK